MCAVGPVAGQAVEVPVDSVASASASAIVTVRIKSAPSPATTTSAYAGIKKKFACSFSECGKSFSRSEHLHRHALNHKEGNNTCARCRAHFRRRDLLDRHMTRHKEKDIEAGGEGMGILATRKRLWKDASGKIINARRPSFINGLGLTKLAIDATTLTAVDVPFKGTLPKVQQRRTKVKVELPSPPLSSISTRTRECSPQTRLACSVTSSARPHDDYDTQGHLSSMLLSARAEDASDCWTATARAPPINLPSPPMSEASLGPTIAVSNSTISTIQHKTTIYGEVMQLPWPVLSNTVPAQQFDHSRAVSDYVHQASSQQWATASDRYSLQAPMESVGQHEDVHNYHAQSEDVGLFKTEVSNDHSLPVIHVGIGLGLGMYEWQDEQPTWLQESATMASRAREERYEAIAIVPEKRNGSGAAWSEETHHTHSPVY